MAMPGAYSMRHGLGVKKGKRIPNSKIIKTLMGQQHYSYDLTRRSVPLAHTEPVLGTPKITLRYTAGSKPNFLYKDAREDPRHWSITHIDGKPKKLSVTGVDFHTESGSATIHTPEYRFSWKSSYEE
jgi:hypothetical protein